MSPRRPPRDPFVVPLDRIPEDGLELRADAATDPAWRAVLEELSEGEGVAPSGTVRIFVKRWPRRVDVEGAFDVVLSQTCSRGLDPYPQPIDAEFRQVLFRTAAELGIDAEELELGAEDLDRSELVGDAQRLLEILREELQLALPMRPLCVTPCEGPCPAWGRDVPLTEPEEERGPDPRWAALASLKLKK